MSTRIFEAGRIFHLAENSSTVDDELTHHPANFLPFRFSLVEMSSQIKVEPLIVPQSSDVNFGATVTNVDVENLSGKIRVIDACFV